MGRSLAIWLPASPPRLWALAQLREYGALAALLVLVAASCLTLEGFATSSNLREIVRSISYTGIVAVGMTFVVIVGCYVDLSAPGQVALAGVVAVTAQPLGSVIAVCLAIGAVLAVGLINGVAVGVLRANSVIVTLGVQSVLVSAIIIATNGSTYYVVPSNVIRAVRASVAGVPVTVLVFIASVVIAEIALTRTVFGARVRGVGMSRSVARASGVGVSRTIFGVFLAMSLASAIGGLAVALSSDSVNFTGGVGYEFNALAAVVVGGTSLLGGSGNVWRTAVGALFLGVLQNVMILLGFSFQLQQVATGMLILLFVWLDTALRSHGMGRSA